MKRIFQSLSVRNYRLFASGQLVSLTGTWMQRVGQDWLVLRLSHNSGTAVGITTGLQFLPLLLFGMYGGVIADRYSKRRLLLGTQAAMAVQAVVLAALDFSHVVTLGEVYALALLLGSATCIDNPTRQAFVTEMVGPDQIVNAVGLNSATFNSARIVGPALAGLLIDLVGTDWVFGINAISYVAVIGGLLMMRDSELLRTPRVARAPGQVREGLRYLRARTDLVIPIMLMGVVGTLGFNFQITLALMDKVVLHRGAGAYGLLSSCIAVGSLVGALTGARRVRPTRTLLIGAAVAFGVLETLVGLMPNYDALAVLLIPTGLAAILLSTTANTTVQLGSDPEMRGRVMGVYMLVFAGGTPIGAPLVGWVAQEWGPRASLLLGGLSSLAAAGAAAVIVLRRGAPERPLARRLAAMLSPAARPLSGTR
jgi:MFS family permease